MFNELVAWCLPIIPRFIVGAVSRRYIAGETLEDAVRVVKDLNAKGMRATVDVLGEFTSDLSQAQATREACIGVLEALNRNRLDANHSIKLTSLGLQIDFQACLDNVTAVLERARTLGNFVRIDMEDSPCTDATLRVFRTVRKSFANTGIVVQSYLKRTCQDVAELTQEAKTNFRLCKGVYVEPAAIAYKDREPVRSNYKKLLHQMADAGSFVGIATHDEVLIEDAKRLIQERKLGPKDYEFQMLLGVREEKRAQLVREGHGMRVYVPFGKDWYGYSTRRLKENPQMAGHVTKAIFGIGQ
jgi:proline dehydrogenase